MSSTNFSFEILTKRRDVCIFVRHVMDKRITLVGVEQGRISQYFGHFKILLSGGRGGMLGFLIVLRFFFLEFIFFCHLVIHQSSHVILSSLKTIKNPAIPLCRAPAIPLCAACCLRYSTPRLSTLLLSATRCRASDSVHNFYLLETCRSVPNFLIAKKTSTLV